jgi:hypothetical protein
MQSIFCHRRVSFPCQLRPLLVTNEVIRPGWPSPGNCSTGGGDRFVVGAVRGGAVTPRGPASIQLARRSEIRRGDRCGVTRPHTTPRRSMPPGGPRFGAGAVRGRETPRRPAPIQSIARWAQIRHGAGRGYATPEGPTPIHVALHATLLLFARARPLRRGAHRRLSHLLQSAGHGNPASMDSSRHTPPHGCRWII